MLAGMIAQNYPESGETNFVLIKTDSAGKEQWNRTFGGTGDEAAPAARECSDGGYILAGYNESRGVNAWLVKTDSEGNEEWNRTFGGVHTDYFQDVQETSDGGYVLAGGTSSSSTGASDAWLIKIDTEGNEKWSRIFGGTGDEAAYSVQETGEGGYILACGTSLLGTDNRSFWLIKTDQDGEEEWNRSFSNTGYDQIVSAKETMEGGYILVGNTRSDSSYLSEKTWLIKTNSDGDEEWNKTVSKANYFHSSSAQETDDGGYIISGYSDFIDEDEYTSWLIKTDPNGDEEWNIVFEKAGDDFINSVQETENGGYILAGHIRPPGGDYKALLIKLEGVNNPLNEIKELKNYTCNLENVDNNTKMVLNKRLEKIINHLEEGKEKKAIRELKQFINYINKMRLCSRISADQADTLIKETQKIIKLMEG
ncbi:FIMAH domain-containing protein [Methanosarcina sp. T3]|uniref:FIMAH domain-containing protein n=1 Tax=Methanosarcina sp. T3 TaxID=3439062 RepID=UPI003F86A57A